MLQHLSGISLLHVDLMIPFWYYKVNYYKVNFLYKIF